MDDLHAAIAAHLRARRRQAAEPHQRDDRILARWYERCETPRCRYCGKPITEGDDLWDVEYRRQARACADHYALF